MPDATPLRSEPPRRTDFVRPGLPTNAMPPDKESANADVSPGLAWATGPISYEEN